MKIVNTKEELSRTSYPGRGIIAGLSEDGEYAVSLNNIETGVYVVNVNGLTCKFVKK